MSMYGISEEKTETYDGLGQMLSINERVDGVKVWAGATVKRHFIHNLPLYILLIQKRE